MASGGINLDAIFLYLFCKNGSFFGKNDNNQYFWYIIWAYMYDKCRKLYARIDNYMSKV